MTSLLHYGGGIAAGWYLGSALALGSTSVVVLVGAIFVVDVLARAVGVDL